MKEITLETLKLVSFNKKDLNHLKFLKELQNDSDITKWFNGLTGGLLHHQEIEPFGCSFFVALKDDTLIGYINIGDYYKTEKTLFLRGAIHESVRGKGAGKRMLLEVSNYLFMNYLQLESIILKIDIDNKKSLNVADACGYKWYERDYYIKYNPYLVQTEMKLGC